MFQILNENSKKHGCRYVNNTILKLERRRVKRKNTHILWVYLWIQSKIVSIISVRIDMKITTGLKLRI